MVKADRGPGRRDVARIAGVAGRQVVGCFSAPTVAVVTGRATASDKAVVKSKSNPVRRRVALSAGLRRWRVRRIFSGGEFIVVTTGTSCWRFSQVAADMATFAGQFGMRARQSKSGCAVIEAWD